MEERVVKKHTRRNATHFASPERSEKVDLYKQIDSISINPVINELLKIEPGLLAVLNKNRQIITVNRSLIESLQFEHASDLLGLRLGEVLNCDYSTLMKAGCGTSEYCMTCGAAIALVVATNENKPAERSCVISAEKDGKKTDYFFKVKATPFVIDREKFILLFIQDITLAYQREYLERVFFHDLNNIVTALETTTELIERKPIDEHERLFKKIKLLSNRLSHEVAMHRLLMTSDIDNYNIQFETIELGRLIEEITDIISMHRSFDQKNLEIYNNVNSLSIETDAILLSRVVLNMLINAFEASNNSDRVKLFFEEDDFHITIRVWNNSTIANEISKRIFQKNFSTKQGIGRGLGTYSMKLFGEKFLRGTIWFDSSEQQKTTFYLRIPKKMN